MIRQNHLTIFGYDSLELGKYLPAFISLISIFIPTLIKVKTLEMERCGTLIHVSLCLILPFLYILACYRYYKNKVEGRRFTKRERKILHAAFFNALISSYTIYVIFILVAVIAF